MSSIGLLSPGANVRHGILWMLLTSVFFVSLDATAKYLTRSYPVIEITWARYLFHFLFVAVWTGLRLPALLPHARFGMQFLRGLFLVGTTVIYFLGLRSLPLPDATSINFLSPILVTALSVPLLGEQVGVRRWIGVAFGFAGAVIIVRPDTGVIQVAALLVMAAAVLNALYQITTRVLGRTDHPVTTNFYSALVGTALMTLGLPFVWTTPSLEGWLLMALAGLFGSVGHYCLIRAFSAAPAVVVSPFGYASLIWSTGFGYLIFGDLPDGWTLLGAFIIIGSGLYIFYREQVKKSEWTKR